MTTNETIPETTPEPGTARNFDLLLDIPLEVTVELGRARLALRDLLALSAGSVVELAKLAGEPLDVLVNGKLVARGECVMVNDKFGVRLTDIVSRSERLARLG
jgi:flagellar motor switch protein FliN/FliY